MVARSFRIVVDGVEREVEGPADRPLLYALHESFEVSGPRFGCGVGDCGACAVLIDGREARSCSVTVSEVDGEVITLEGLAKAQGREGGLHPVQEAWIAEQVPQCGYCQNGMIMMAVDLLSRVPDPTVAQIREAFSSPSPHLCRCGTYAAIVRAVQRAAKEMQ
jgi:isoquinoline 1-oxidoreductase alpha subunit